MTKDTHRHLGCCTVIFVLAPQPPDRWTGSSSLCVQELVSDCVVFCLRNKHAVGTGSAGGGPSGWAAVGQGL